MRGFIKTVHFFQFGNEFGRQALGAAIFAAAACALHIIVLLSQIGFTADITADPCRGVAAETLDLGNHLFNGAARRHLNNQKIHKQYAEQSRDDQKQTAKNILRHR